MWAVLWLAGTAAAGDLAVIVHPENPVAALTLRELRSYLRMDRQFWPDGRAAEIYLRTSGGREVEILLETVYHTDVVGLRRFWVERLYRGEIASVPPVAPTAAQAGARVGRSPGALSVVLAEEVPPGVRVIPIDGLLPGQPGYALTDG